MLGHLFSHEYEDSELFNGVSSLAVVERIFCLCQLGEDKHATCRWTGTDYDNNDPRM